MQLDLFFFGINVVNTANIIYGK